MASPEILDFEKLSAPVPGDNPAGSDQRHDTSPNSLYYSVKDSRQQAREAERQLSMAIDEDSSDYRPDWRPVLTLGQKLLAERSKDLEISAYIIEALVRLQGFAGARDGFKLTRQLIESYWDAIYPMPDEDGVVTRIAPLEGLNGSDAEGTLPQPIMEIPITEGTDQGPFSCWQYQQASEISRIEDPTTKERRIKQGAVSMEMFDKAVAQTSGQFFVDLLEDINGSIEEFTALTAVLEEKCGSNAPASSSIRSALSNCRDVVDSVSKPIRAKMAAAAEMQAAADGGAATGDGAPAGGGAAVGGPTINVGGIRTREDALRTLLLVADFFRRTEPHTPLSYALEQAVRWGKMSLPELLNELIPDKGSRDNLFKLVGIPAPAEENASG